MVKLSNRYPALKQQGGKNQFKALYASIVKEVRTFSLPEPPPNASTCIGTAGTITSLAALKLKLQWYKPEKVNNTVLTFKEIKDITCELLSFTEEERDNLPQLEKGRGDLIIPGAILLLVIMEQYQQNEICVIDSGMREGNLITLYKNHAKGFLV